MKTSKHIFQFADHLVFHYAKLDKLSGSYSIDIHSIPDFDLHELASLLMAEDNELVMEATSIDNPWYEKIMLPALLQHMQNSSDRDKKEDFNKAWKQGILNYLEKKMQQILDEQCSERLYSEKAAEDFYPFTRPDNGELFWRKRA